MWRIGMVDERHVSSGSKRVIQCMFTTPPVLARGHFLHRVNGKGGGVASFLHSQKGAKCRERGAEYLGGGLSGNGMLTI